MVAFEILCIRLLRAEAIATTEAALAPVTEPRGKQREIEAGRRRTSTVNESCAVGRDDEAVTHQCWRMMTRRSRQRETQ